MKKKDNISRYIKEELNQRELNPSHDSWNRIQARMDVIPTTKNSNYKWWLSAAVFFIFTLSTTIYLFTNKKEQNIPNTDFVKNEVNIDTAKQNLDHHTNYSTNNTLATNEKNNVEIISTIEIEKKNTNNELAKTKEKKDSTVNNKSELKAIIEQKKNLVAANKLDSIKKTKKENNYVDPDMLLYSIENKENIKESNKSRVVSIDVKK